MIEINFLQNNNIKVDLEKKPEINLGLENKLSIIPPTNHSELLGLDYESSGHTGFASSKDLENYVPKKVSLIGLNNNVDRSKISLYAIYENQTCNISMNDILDKKIRTVVEIPNDYKIGDYLFLEKKEI